MYVLTLVVSLIVCTCDLALSLHLSALQNDASDVMLMYTSVADSHYFLSCPRPAALSRGESFPWT
jgi:hypothetical protein